MKVSIQVLALLFSFLYGGIDVFLLMFFKKYLMLGNIYKKMLYNSIFMVFNVFIYFILMYFINGGIFHYYFLIVYELGFILFYKLYVYIRCQL